MTIRWKMDNEIAIMSDENWKPSKSVNLARIAVVVNTRVHHSEVRQIEIAKHGRRARDNPIKSKAAVQFYSEVIPGNPIFRLYIAAVNLLKPARARWQSPFPRVVSILS